MLVTSVREGTLRRTILKVGIEQAKVIVSESNTDRRILDVRFTGLITDMSRPTSVRVTDYRQRCSNGKRVYICICHSRYR